MRGLFEERFVDQVQVVAYPHEWDPRELRTPGKFIYWDTRDGKSPQEVMPFPRAGVAVDGSKTVHAAMPYRIEGPAPVIDKDSHNELMYQGDDQWFLMKDGVFQTNYSTTDLRISIVYRARCFADAQEAERFGGNGGPEEDRLQLDEIISTFAKDLVARGRANSEEEVLQMDRMDLATELLSYVKYPVSQRKTFPLNYCALGSLFPSLQQFIRIICPQ